ncbi:MAG: tetratricopeptide repeat protein [Candidatus Omnitrophica bacterium]|nr:tetratricopeptide repeat protein [Candidatus Omnitrophota bacterium]
MTNQFIMSKRRRKEVLKVKPVVNELEDRIKSFNFRTWLRKYWKALLVLTLLVCIAYANSLGSDFVSDDTRSIARNLELDKPGYIFNQSKITIHSLFCFFINKIVGRIPLFFRLVNISFHLGVVLITFLLFSLLTDSKVAFFIACILAVHPIQTESVSWISAAPYVQYSFFFLLALLTYILSVKNKKLFLISIISFILSLQSHDMAVVLPLIFFLFVISFGDIRKNWKSLIPFFVISIILGLILVGRGMQRIETFQTDFYQQPQILNPLIQIPIAITSYLELIFWPKGLTLYHSEMSFSQAEYILRLIIFIIFLGIIVYSFRRSRRVFFGLSFFVITLLPTLTPLGITWIVAERYVYLGAIGIFMVVALGIKRLGEIRYLKIAIRILFSLIIMALLTRTVIRNIDWKNEDNLWIATARTSPSSPNTHNNLGDVYSRHGEWEKAVYEFKKAIEIKPGYADAYHNLAHTYYLLGKLTEAIESYQNAIHFNPNLWQSYQNLAGIYFELKNINLAMEYLKKAIEVNPANSQLRTNLGIAYLMLDRKLEAREEFEKSLQLDPNNKRTRQLLYLLP